MSTNQFVTFLLLYLWSSYRMRSDMWQCPVFRDTSSNHSTAKSDSTTHVESFSSVSPASDRLTSAVSECTPFPDRQSELRELNCRARIAPDCVLVDALDCVWPFRGRRGCRRRLAFDLAKCSNASMSSQFVDHSRCGWRREKWCVLLSYCVMFAYFVIVFCSLSSCCSPLSGHELCI